MTCDLCVVTVVLSFVSLPPFSPMFSGDDYDDIDPVLAEHYDALGHDLSFRGWD